jgi:hypothetical protein
VGGKTRRCLLHTVCANGLLQAVAPAWLLLTEQFPDLGYTDTPLPLIHSMLLDAMDQLTACSVFPMPVRSLEAECMSGDTGDVCVLCVTPCRTPAAPAPSLPTLLCATHPRASHTTVIGEALY